MAVERKAERKKRNEGKKGGKEGTRRRRLVERNQSEESEAKGEEKRARPLSISLFLSLSRRAKTPIKQEKQNQTHIRHVDSREGLFGEEGEGEEVAVRKREQQRHERSGGEQEERKDSVAQGTFPASFAFPLLSRDEKERGDD